MSVSLGFGPENPKRRLESGSPLLDPTRSQVGLPNPFTSQPRLWSSAQRWDRNKARSGAQGREQRRFGGGPAAALGKPGRGRGWGLEDRTAPKPSRV